jgi:hypothetical protein
MILHAEEQYSANFRQNPYTLPVERLRLSPEKEFIKVQILSFATTPSLYRKAAIALMP